MATPTPARLPLAPRSALFLAALLPSLPAAAIGPVVHGGDPDRAAGDILQVALPAVGLGLALYRGDGAGVKEWGYGLGATLIVTQGLKKSLNATSWGERPNGGKNAFPSGHTSAACYGAAFVGRRHGWGYGAGVMAASAAFVGYSRVDERLHRWRDVAAGCAIGYGASLLFVNPKETPAFVLVPTIGRRSWGLALSTDF
jgi:membrane-associated phospholipid phosphatase